MHITWFGHSCFLLETGTHRLLFDPWLEGNPTASIRVAEVHCDFILCTHAHEDHCADALEISRRNHAPIIAPYELARYFSAQGAETFDPMQGGSIAFPFGRVKLTPAVHSSSLEQPDGRNLPLGAPGGFVVSAANKNIYHAGDTALFSDMSLIGRAKLDLALLPIGDWYTMGIDEAVDALDLLRPKLALPMHYNTFENIQVDPQRFVSLAAARGHVARVLQPGQTVEF
jgi:L-ascorbate metabolism protein UlaG (beta-lactamase superfamily)